MLRHRLSLIVEKWYKGYMSVLTFTLGGILPVFLLIVLGVILKRLNLVGEGFQKSASHLCFKLGLPSLAIVKISVLDFTQVFNPTDIAVTVGVTLAVMAIVMVLSLRMKDVHQRGCFAQGCYRGNIAIVGLALILNLYGEEYAARGAMILALMLPIYNITSVIILTLPLHGLSLKGISKSLKNIARNPIIWGVFIAMALSLLRVSLPPPLFRLFRYLADMTIPLALINIGSSLRARGLKQKGAKALAAASVKLVILPAVGTTVCHVLGYGRSELGMIFLIMGAPTAVSSHIMAEAMDNDGELAALIIMISTSLAALTSMIGLSIIEGFL